MTVLLDQAETTIGVPGTDISTTWVQVTPQMAEELLKSNTKNRNVRPKHLEKLVRDMKNDKYLVTHQGIAMSEDGVLIDGQHRLKAIIESNTTQWVLFTTGLPMKAQEEVDGGAKRQAGDLGLLKESGYGHTKAAALRLLLSIEEMDHVVSTAQFSRVVQNFTTADLQEAYQLHREAIDRHLTEAVAAGQRLKRRVGIAALLACATYYPDRAGDFLGGLANNAIGLSDSDPRVALLKFQGTGRVQVPVAAFVSLKAARYFHFGMPLSVIRYRQNEQMDLRKSPRIPSPNSWSAQRDAKKNGKETDEGAE